MYLGGVDGRRLRDGFEFRLEGESIGLSNWLVVGGEAEFGMFLIIFFWVIRIR